MDMSEGQHEVAHQQGTTALPCQMDENVLTRTVRLLAS